jgi:enoyl-CoA hydratase/carnithine racemase
MQTLQADYFAAYRNLKLSRDDKGVLVAEFHSDGGPFIMNAQAHTEFVDAFHRIGQDRENKIVIVTGAGGNFIGDVEWPSFGDVADPGVWSRIHDEGLQTLENIANIRVPVIAAVEGRAHIHSDYALLASVIVAAEGATSRTSATLPWELRRVTGFLQHGVIGLEQVEPRRSRSIHSRCRRAPHTSGESLRR